MKLWNWLRWKLGYEVRVPEDYPTIMAAYLAGNKARHKRGEYDKCITVRVTSGHSEWVIRDYTTMYCINLIFDGPGIEFFGSDDDRPSITIDEEKT